MDNEITPEEKLGELLLLLAKLLADEPLGGATKLNKLLYFAEFAHMRETGRPITGLEYQCLPNGPAPRQLKPVRRRLVESGDASVEEEPVLGFIQHRLVPKRDPRPGVFSETEVAAIQEVVTAYQTYSGSELSDLSHLDPPWNFFEEGETIPYEMAFLRPGSPGPAARDRARELAEKYANR